MENAEIEIEAKPRGVEVAKKRVCFVLAGAWAVLLVATILLMTRAATIENEYTSRIPTDCTSVGNSVGSARSWVYEYQGHNYTLLAACSCASPAVCYVLRGAPNDAVVNWDVPDTRNFIIWATLGVALLWLVVSLVFVGLRYCSRTSVKLEMNLPLITEPV